MAGMGWGEGGETAKKQCTVHVAGLLGYQV